MPSLTRTFIFLVLMFAASTAASASDGGRKGSWSGSASLSGGTNIFPAVYDSDFSNTSGEGTFKLSYKTSKFVLNTSLSGGGSMLSTYIGAGSAIAFDTQSIKYNMDYTVEDAKKSNIKLSADATWTPGIRDKFTIFLGDSYNHESPIKVTATEGSDDNGFVDMSYTYTYEDTDNNKNRFENAYSWEHNFQKDGRKLFSKADWYISEDDRYSRRISGKGKEDDIEDINMDKCYRLTPHYREYRYGIISKYADKDFAGVSRLDFDASLELSVKGNRDFYSAANFIPDGGQGHWEDSVRYRENFRYVTITASPRIHARYAIDKFLFEGDITPEYFTDKLCNDEYTEDFDKGSISPVGELKVTFNPTAAHRISISGKRSISRPAYLNLCWFQRPGAYINELQQGNPLLLPSVTNKLSMLYDLTAGQFSGSLEAGYTFVDDKIEKTFHEETISETQYRIYTWINAGYSRTLNGKLMLKWTGKRFKADITGNYNLVTNVDQKGNESRNSDYSINGNASYDFSKGWKALARLRYQSKIIRSYSSITEYVGLDLRAEKKIKKFTLFLEGRDLLDKDITTETISEDRKKIRQEINNYNRRVILLGATFNF